MRLMIAFVLSFVALVPFAVLIRGLSPLEALLIPLGALIAISVALAHIWAHGRVRE